MPFFVFVEITVEEGPSNFQNKRKKKERSLPCKHLNAINCSQNIPIKYRKKKKELT